MTICLQEIMLCKGTVGAATQSVQVISSIVFKPEITLKLEKR